MVNIILCGCCGRMGHVIRDTIASYDDFHIVAGVDLVIDSNAGFPIYKEICEVTESADVIIDFSHPSTLPSLLRYTKTTGIPVVISTTGYSEEQVSQIQEAAKTSPIFFSFNMSLGVNLLLELTKKATCVLGESFDIEIVEAHHNQKVDAPSGTAIMIANTVKSALNDEAEFVYDRHTRRQRREKKEIGIHSLRGGTIVGEHRVIFAGKDEIVTLSHSAHSKEIFAVGAVRAALYMVGKPTGLYSMSDLMK